MGKVLAIFLHLDHLLPQVFNLYGDYAILLLFVIIFLESALIFFPFLPGDSLLFATGLLAASNPSLNILFLWLVLGIAAAIGNKVNFSIGRFFGDKILAKTHFIQEKHLEQSHLYFDSKGAKAIILCRFIPIFRSFIPFIAGVSHMSYKRFTFYNLLGGTIWTGLFLLSGYFFAGIPWVRSHFSLVILGIMILSILPPAIDLLKGWVKKPL